MWDEYPFILRCNECSKTLAHVPHVPDVPNALCPKCYKEYNPPPTNREIKQWRKERAESKKYIRDVIKACSDSHNKRKLINRRKGKRK